MTYRSLGTPPGNVLEISGGLYTSARRIFCPMHLSRKRGAKGMSAGPVSDKVNPAAQVLFGGSPSGRLRPTARRKHPARQSQEVPKTCWENV